MRTAISSSKAKNPDAIGVIILFMLVRMQLTIVLHVLNSIHS
jgi:hypothetical protein